MLLNLYTFYLIVKLKNFQRIFQKGSEGLVPESRDYPEYSYVTHRVLYKYRLVYNTQLIHIC